MIIRATHYIDIATLIFAGMALGVMVFAIVMHHTRRWRK